MTTTTKTIAERILSRYHNPVYRWTDENGDHIKSQNTGYRWTDESGLHIEDVCQAEMSSKSESEHGVGYTFPDGSSIGYDAFSKHWGHGLDS